MRRGERREVNRHPGRRETLQVEDGAVDVRLQPGKDLAVVQPAPRKVARGCHSRGDEHRERQGNREYRTGEATADAFGSPRAGAEHQSEGDDKPGSAQRVGCLIAYERGKKRHKRQHQDRHAQRPASYRKREGGNSQKEQDRLPGIEDRAARDVVLREWIAPLEPGSCPEPHVLQDVWQGQLLHAGRPVEHVRGVQQGIDGHGCQDDHRHQRCCSGARPLLRGSQHPEAKQGDDAGHPQIG